MRKILMSVVALCVVSSFAAEQPGYTFTPYGLAQYRLRTQINTLTPDVGSSTIGVDYNNQVGYYIGATAQIDQVTLGMQIGNDWISTEKVTYAVNNSTSKRSALSPYFHLAYVKWDPGFLHIVAGKQPVISYGALDLLERSLGINSYGGAYSAKTFGAPFVSWAVGTNNSELGLKIGAPVLKGPFKLGVDLFSTVIESRAMPLITDAKPNPSSVLMILDVPMGISAFTFTPQIATVFNRNFNSTRGKGDNEYDVGLAAEYKATTKLSFTAFGAFGTYNNKNSRVAVDSFTVVKDTSYSLYGQQGIIGGIGSTIKFGPGALVIELKGGTSENTEITNSAYTYVFSDFKYGWNITKNFTIMPRIREFMTLNPDANTNKSQMETRPEIIFTGKF